MTCCIKEYYFCDLKARWKILYKSVCKQKEFIILKSLHVIILVYTFISLLFYKFLVKVQKRSKCIFMDNYNDVFQEDCNIRLCLVI